MEIFDKAFQWLIENGGPIGILALFSVLANIALYRDGNKTRDNLAELNEKRVNDLIRSTEVLSKLTIVVESNKAMFESVLSELRSRQRS